MTSFIRREEVKSVQNNDVFKVQKFPAEEIHLPIDGKEGSMPPGEYIEDCMYSCSTINDFIKLTDDMMKDILLLEEELVRWRQALIKYLPERWAEGLRQDIFNNTARCYAGDSAYDLYVQAKGYDPQQSEEHTEFTHRLANGTDESSITYL